MNNTNDVPGAQPGTLKKCPETMRRTNPLQPWVGYKLPGHTEIPFAESNAFADRPVSSLDPKYVKARKQHEEKMAKT